MGMPKGHKHTAETKAKMSASHLKMTDETRAKISAANKGQKRSDAFRAKMSKIKTKHGYAKRGQKTSEYTTWESMNARCNNQNNPSYEDYGGRGIKVCESWKNFQHFYDDMGERPEGMSLDRIDNSLGYDKENCRWATAKEQIHNQRPRRHHQAFKQRIQALEAENDLLKSQILDLV